ncbi:MAG TPA: Hpt domain-containing protein [Thermoanaerobaculia bacterium]|jgi:HPt (histidine-containing phosphotransfer) domain-containing protein|nr:Hpt domain-containing protein [Thermoanaerobaculia bacterium]
MDNEIMGPALDEEAIASLRDLGDGDDVFLLELLEQYVEQTDRLVIESAVAAGNGDLQSWVGTMHALAGSSRNVGALRLASVCTAAEVDGRSTSTINTLPFLADFARDYEAVKREIATIRGLRLPQ